MTTPTGSLQRLYESAGPQDGITADSVQQGPGNARLALDTIPTEFNLRSITGLSIAGQVITLAYTDGTGTAQTLTVTVPTTGGGISADQIARLLPVLTGLTAGDDGDFPVYINGGGNPAVYWGNFADGNGYTFTFDSDAGTWGLSGGYQVVAALPATDNYEPGNILKLSTDWRDYRIVDTGGASASDDLTGWTPASTGTGEDLRIGFDLQSDVTFGTRPPGWPTSIHSFWYDPNNRIEMVADTGTFHQGQALQFTNLAGVSWYLTYQEPAGGANRDLFWSGTALGVPFPAGSALPAGYTVHAEGGPTPFTTTAKSWSRVPLSQGTAPDVITNMRVVGDNLQLDRATTPIKMPIRDLGHSRGHDFPGQPTAGETFVKLSDGPEGRAGEYIAVAATIQGASWTQTNAPSGVNAGNDGFSQWSTNDNFGAIEGPGAEWVAYSWSRGVGNGNLEVGWKARPNPPSEVYLAYQNATTEGALGLVAVGYIQTFTQNGIALDAYGGATPGAIDAALAQTAYKVQVTRYLDAGETELLDFPDSRWHRLPDAQDIQNALYADFRGLEFRLVAGATIDAALPPNSVSPPFIAQLVDSLTSPTQSDLYVLRHDDRTVDPNPGRIVLQMAAPAHPQALVEYEQGVIGSVKSGNAQFIRSAAVADAGSGSAILYFSTIDAVYKPDPLKFYITVQAGTNPVSARLTSYAESPDVGETRWQCSIASGFNPAHWPHGVEETITFFEAATGTTQVALNAPQGSSTPSQHWDLVGVELPPGGTVGQVLTRIGDASGWQDLAAVTGAYEELLDYSPSSGYQSITSQTFVELPADFAFSRALTADDDNKLLLIALAMGTTATRSAEQIIATAQVTGAFWRNLRQTANLPTASTDNFRGVSGVVIAPFDGDTSAAGSWIRSIVGKGANDRLGVIPNRGTGSIYIYEAKVALFGVGNAPTYPPVESIYDGDLTLGLVRSTNGNDEFSGGFDPAFDLDDVDNQKGLTSFSGTLTITSQGGGAGADHLGFDEDGLTSAQTIRVNGQETAKAIRASTVYAASTAAKSGTRGVKVGPEIPLYHDPNVQGNFQVYLSRNVNNQLLWVVLYVGIAGTFSPSVSLTDVEAVFIRLP